MDTPITTEFADPGARLRLMQLISPSLPVGGVTYSQGLEWAVECGWVATPDAFARWQQQLIDCQLSCLDLPLLQRLYLCARQQDDAGFARWSAMAVSCRETRELRLEEQQRGQALVRLMAQWPSLPLTAERRPALEQSGLAALAWLGWQWRIPLQPLALGYGYSTLEGSVMAGLKLVTFGQQTAQGLLATLAATLPAAWQHATALDDEELGGSFPLQAISSACHETQYSRLFRS
ncbi:urease accessory protein UreF [Candidatus Sodalis endolongispinus]|uniref:Urease accessory protein UreF n=1 Tax=Candidatus Sodalis endolongispinus TaxID=2812662 RepID=A0ABS5YCJ3_9GAMM|nr:urease accessory UreF family protein [Candidatus Sodalis endolongispinus]MBT9432688.1 urease accessory protein UreF [Candidatus Sodalis endolongispinus]